MRFLVTLLIGVLTLSCAQVALTQNEGNTTIPTPLENGTTNGLAGTPTTMPSVSTESSTVPLVGPGVGQSTAATPTETASQGPMTSGNICLPQDVVKTALEFPRQLAFELLASVRSVLSAIPGVGSIAAAKANGSMGLFGRKRRSIDLKGIGKLMNYKMDAGDHDVDEGRELIKDGRVLTPYHGFLHALMDAIHRELNAASKVFKAKSDVKKGKGPCSADGNVSIQNEEQPTTLKPEDDVEEKKGYGRFVPIGIESKVDDAPKKSKVEVRYKRTPLISSYLDLGPVQQVAEVDTEVDSKEASIDVNFN